MYQKISNVHTNTHPHSVRCHSRSHLPFHSNSFARSIGLLTHVHRQNNSIAHMCVCVKRPKKCSTLTPRNAHPYRFLSLFHFMSIYGQHYLYPFVYTVHAITTASVNVKSSRDVIILCMYLFVYLMLLMWHGGHGVVCCIFFQCW